MVLFCPTNNSVQSTFVKHHINLLTTPELDNGQLFRTFHNTCPPQSPNRIESGPIYRYFPFHADQET